MKEYSIKEIEEFTGIKAHTLRIWEQRYGLFNPKRSSTNIRSYSDDDVKKALNINLLYSNGWKISKIAALSAEDLILEAEKIVGESGKSDDQQLDFIIRYIVAFDEGGIVDSLEELYQEKGLVQTYTDVLIPLLVRIGNLWQVGAVSVAQEHFFSNILREFILLKTNELSINEGSPKMVLFLHENEMHELGLLMTQYFLKEQGINCFYLGAKVPTADLKKCVQSVKPDYLLTSFVSRIHKDQIRAIVNEIATFFELKNLIVCGYQVEHNPTSFPEGVKKVKRITDLPSFLK
ncbi:MAG: MerR family transcriptional regulator [Crocinitomicaceae bacterium]|nr:MerR family transcriptional regulator [Crocinitomicaceae bacterium]